MDGVGTSQQNSKFRYVSANDGSDDDAGTEDEPWKTLQHAAEEVSPGTTVLVDDSGPYAPVEFWDGGEAGADVVFKNKEEGTMPTILGDRDEEALVRNRREDGSRHRATIRKR